MGLDLLDLSDILSHWRWGRTLVAVILGAGLWFARVPTTNLIVHQYEDRITALTKPFANCVDYAGAVDTPKLVCTAVPVTMPSPSR